MMSPLRLKHPKLRRAAIIIISYLMFLFMTVSVSGLIMMQTVTSAAFVIARIEKSGFSETALAEIREKYISHGAASGIPPGIMDSALTQRHVDNAIKTTVRSIYGTGTAYAFDLYGNELFEIFRDYAAAQGKAETEELTAGLKDLADLCVTDFKAHISPPVLDTLGAYISRSGTVIRTVTLIAIILTLSAAMLLKVLNTRLSGLMSSYIHAFGATALVCGAVPAALFGSGLTKSIGITPPSYGNLISSCIEGAAEGFLIALIPLLLLLAVFSAVWVSRRRRRRRYTRR